jgi:predicted ABC-type transport system involved in lysophospholipase L1 biosynthesis ATPase subunit
MSAGPLIEIVDLTKNYLGLRPLRIARLSVRPGERLALGGFDAVTAELFVHLVTGATLPDEGNVRVAGRSTREIATDTEWLASLDRFGIVTARAVLLDALPIAANLALPFTLAIDPMSGDVRQKVNGLAVEVGLDPDRLAALAVTLTPAERLRVHLGRALAVNPLALLLEHPTALLDAHESHHVAQVLKRVSAARNLAWVALTEDDAFARAADAGRLRLNAATGVLSGEPGGIWKKILARVRVP